MILIADVDIDLLRELNQFGAVRNLGDRRKDIFSLKRTEKLDQSFSRSREGGSLVVISEKNSR